MATETIQGLNHSFKVGDAITLTYPFVVPRPYPGRVTKVTSWAIYATFDHNPEVQRFFVRRQVWRDQFGGQVILKAVTQ